MLRGINVSGQKKIAMKDLKSLYESLQFNNVVTYIQSGNVIFSSNKSDVAKLSRIIEKEIDQVYGYVVPVIIRTAAEFKKVMKKNRYLKKTDIDLAKLHITFLSAEPQSAAITKLNEVKNISDEYFIDGKEVYLYSPGGYGKSKLSNVFLEKKLDLSATTRNWKTVSKLYELSSNEG